MTRRLRGFTLRALLFLGICAPPAAAQQTMTITGHVSAASQPVRGARVRIESLDLGATTDESGRYSFIIPSARVRGQTVQMTVTYSRFRTDTASVSLVGGSIVKDFDLVPVTAPGQQPTGGQATPPVGGSQPRASQPANVPVGKPVDPTPTLPTPSASIAAPAVRATVPVQSADSTVFTDIAGAVDVAGAIQGRLAGVDVLTTSTPGGTNNIVVRGPRTLVGVTQPLVVVNGVIVDVSNLTTLAQRSGLGGFDYGTLLSDLNVEDVASLQLLTGPEAALRYGGRGANGALVITTRSAKGLNGFEVAASQQVTGLSIIKLPSYQNSYGQGRGGLFAFFNGKGGGINDASDESWGPALTGAPTPQASLTEAGRAEVRAFNPVPDNVSGYFKSGHSVATNVALLGGNESGYARGSLSIRSLSGVVPSTSVSTRSALFTAGTIPSAKLAATVDLQYYNTVGEDRPGTGFDESNVVSQFSHMPRQVDVAGYRTLLRDASGAQLSWNYAGRNNPWVATVENRNHDDRSRIVGGASGSFALSKWITASGRIGTDRSSDTRTFSVTPGWQGGFPYYAGRGDFSNGGFQTDDISRTLTSADVLLRAAPQRAGTLALAFTGGVGRRADDVEWNVRASDNLAGSSTTPAPSTWKNTTTSNYLFGGVEALVRDMASLTVGARQESSAPTGTSSVSTLYPAVIASIDLMRLDSAASTRSRNSLILHGGWSKSGNEATSGVLQRLGFGSPANAAAVASVSKPEVTTGWEAGVSTSLMDRRFTASITAYNDRSENLIFPSGTSFLQSGTMANKGIEAALTLVPARTASGEWTIGANLAKNDNTVESLAGGTSAVALGSPFSGVTVEARTGQPLGALVGLGYLRDASGALLLRGGLPVADSAAGVKVLGQSLPTLVGGLTTAFRGRGFEFSMLVDAHQGGKVFSASNRAGAVSGVLAETSVRPDSGLLISGLDATTRQANTTHVSTEAYYHALAPIAERWLYDASFVKLREVRFGYALPLQFIRVLQAQTVRASFIARNLATWSSAPNIDPETVLSTSTMRGVEMGQLPSVRAFGIQITLVP